MVCVYFMNLRLLSTRQLDYRELRKRVYRFVLKRRMWTIKKITGIQARRKGFALIPDFGSTAHMVQSATLDVAFADFQDARSIFSRVAQRVVYVCLSRVKTMDSIQTLQPFSTLLFARGAPTCSKRLIRKLSNEISSAEALNGCMQDSEDSQEQETTVADPMKCTRRCISSYLLGYVVYMHPAKSSGRTPPSHCSNYVPQGCWTRCLRCPKNCMYYCEEPSRRIALCARRPTH